MGKRILYTCDFCGSTINLDKQVGKAENINIKLL